MAVPSPPTKIAMRADALVRRKAYAATLSPALRAELEARLSNIVLPHLLTSSAVAAYYPMREEISPLSLLDAVIASGQTAALPWFGGRDSRMIFREVPAVEAGPWGVLQPASEAQAVAPDTVLVPLVLADRAGTRIGHGKGHYDRALSHLRESRQVFTIGLAWEWQVSAEPIPADPWDVPLDAIATPGEWIDCR